MTSSELEVGCRGLHSVTLAKPRTYWVRITLLTAFGEPMTIILMRSRLGCGAVGMSSGLGDVGVSLVLGRNSSIGVSLSFD